MILANSTGITNNTCGSLRLHVLGSKTHHVAASIFVARNPCNLQLAVAVCSQYPHVHTCRPRTHHEPHLRSCRVRVCVCCEDAVGCARAGNRRRRVQTRGTDCDACWQSVRGRAHRHRHRGRDRDRDRDRDIHNRSISVKETQTETHARTCTCMHMQACRRIRRQSPKHT